MPEIEANESKFRFHVFVCTHNRSPDNPRGCCSTKNSLELMSRLKRSAKESGVGDVRVQKSGCLDQCENGPSCVVYPEGYWYTLTEDSLDEILQSHLALGRPVEKYKMGEGE